MTTLQKPIRIEVATTVFDSRAQTLKNKLADLELSGKIDSISVLDVYTVDKDFTKEDLEKIGESLCNPVTQAFSILSSGHPEFISGSQEMLKQVEHDNDKFTFAIEIGFLPGVTDNIAHTTKEIIEDLLKVKFTKDENVYTSQISFITGKITLNDAQKIADSLYNPVIQRTSIKSYEQFVKDNGMDFIVPKVKLAKKPTVLEIDLEISDKELTKIGKSGIENPDGTRNGPLALDLTFMKTIQAYFKKLGRKPTDIELESIAQTWSEHCKHTIFADPMDEIKDGLYETYIKKATKEIRQNKGKDDICVSVFTDNSGAIIFDKDYLITHKVETHNSPSALDPFGGSITGIVGVNRDTIGFGLGAKPVANFYGFCFADPRVDIPLYKGANKTQKMLSSKRIMNGVIDGVNAGGNQSGIPTPQGFVYFDEHYRGKPLVFVGTVGLIPKKIKDKKSYIKKANNGDYIVMVGGRVGKDGIHGATFSSEAMDSGSPATAVQIGDPITQKKLSDALVKEARDMLLYTSITDNGAGGLSCSVAEMAKESGGSIVELEKVPLKYPGLEPWETWISESQERMTLSVPKQNWLKFKKLMDDRGVEATVIGTFTNSGKCVVTNNGKTIMDMDMDFLHDGLPKRTMETVYVKPVNKEPEITEKKDLIDSLLQMLQRLNITSFEFISQQYDHIVQAGLVLSPLQGRGRINSETSVIRPVLSSQKGVMLSQGLYPRYSFIDTYHMATASIDTAIRNMVAAGGNPDKIALLDNFCWCSATEPQRLGELKMAAKACYDLTIAFGTPLISGKDSMFNDFKGYDKDGSPIKISIPPTLLVSSISVVDDITKVVSLDVKMSDDLIYLIGDTSDELGGSEYFAIQDAIGNNVPKVNAQKNMKLYKSYYQAIQQELIASSISVTKGGLAVALAKMSMGGMLGIDVSLKDVSDLRDDFILYSESQGRIIATVAPINKAKFETLLKNQSFKLIGKVTKEPNFIIKGTKGNDIVKTTVDEMLKKYKSTFAGY